MLRKLKFYLGEYSGGIITVSLVFIFGALALKAGLWQFIGMSVSCLVVLFFDLNGRIWTGGHFMLVPYRRGELTYGLRSRYGEDWPRHLADSILYYAFVLFGLLIGLALFCLVFAIRISGWVLFYWTLVLTLLTVLAENIGHRMERSAGRQAVRSQAVRRQDVQEPSEELAEEAAS